VCCDGAKISQRVYCGREDGVMGSLEARGVAEGDRTSFWQAIIVDLFSGGTAWWDSSCRAASLQAGIDARGARGDFRGITARQSARSMAKLLGRSPSTISREMSRNGGYDRYRATLADEKAWARARRPKYCKLATNLRLRQAVAGELRLDWSPEQIAGWLKRTHPEDECNQVTRDDLPELICTNTWRAQKRAA
jgi:hypothetical protein